MAILFSFLMMRMFGFSSNIMSLAGSPSASAS